MTLDEAFAPLYRDAVLKSDREKAVSDMRTVFTDHPSVMDEAKAYVAENGKIDSRRCFITAIRVELLKAALA